MSASCARYRVSVSANVMIPMRDGIRLATDIYRPALTDGVPDRGKFPALLIRTSYDKRDRMWNDLKTFYVARGYVLAIQDLRSRYASEGDGRYYHTVNPWEGRDGFDTVEWLADQRWCTGKVGTLGSSHLAIVQTQLALEQPPHLSAMWPEVGPTNIFKDQGREGGAMALHMYAALFIHALDAHEIGEDPDKLRVLIDGMINTRDWIQSTPFRKGGTPLRVAPNLESVLINYYTRGEYDDWWARDCANPAGHFERHADVPIVIGSGWYDPFTGTALDYYLAMASQNSSPARVIIGPWDHDGRLQGRSNQGEVDFGQDSVWGESVYGPERLRWFDRWLKDIDTGVEAEPPVRIFVMGGGDGNRTSTGLLNHGGKWRHENEWPIARTRYVKFFMQHNNVLCETAPEVDDASFDFIFDPEKPVPSIGGNVTGFLEYIPDDSANAIPVDIPSGERWAHVVNRARSVVRQGPMHQRERENLVASRPPYPLLCDRPDVLAFQTLPLKVEIEVTGRVTANLWIASSAIDTDFTVKLLDIYPANSDWPDGFHMNLADTILRCRYRSSWTDPEFLTPGEVYPITISLPPTSNLFKVGHRIRIDVSSSNFPRLDINPNTGEPIGRHTHSITATNRLYTDNQRPSHVVLPVIPI